MVCIIYFICQYIFRIQQLLLAILLTSCGITPLIDDNMPSLDISGKVLQEEVPTQIPDTQITATIWHGNNLFDVLDSPITGIDTPNLIEIPDITNDIFTEENPLSPVYDKLKKYSYFDSSEE